MQFVLEVPINFSDFFRFLHSKHCYRGNVMRKKRHKSYISEGYCLGTSIVDSRYLHIWDSKFLQYLNVEYQTDRLEDKAVHCNKLVGISQSRSSCTSLTEKCLPGNHFLKRCTLNKHHQWKEKEWRRGANKSR